MAYIGTYIFASILLCLFLAKLALAAEVGPASVICRGPLPFDQAQLLQAIKLRVPLMRIQHQQAMPAVEVQAREPNRATITVGPSRRVISLRGLSSEEAARVIALLALDLMISQQQAPTISGQHQKPEKPSKSPSGSDVFFIGLSPRLSLGVEEWDPSFEPCLDLSLRISRYFGIFLEGGFTWAEAGDGDRHITLYEIPIRAGAAFRYSFLEVRAGLALRPYFVEGAGEDSGAFVGGGLGVHFQRSLTARLKGYVAAGVDFFSLRKDFQVGNKTVLSTSWAIPWLGIGAGWQGG